MGDRCKEVVVMDARPDLLDGLAILRVYFAELISRYQRRPATPEEITAEMLEDPSNDLQPPTGRFLVAFQGRQPVGCIGFRRRSDTVAAVTRMFIIEEARRRGIGVRLLRDLETIARDRGFIRLELDTRDDLVEARRLYLRAGFAEVPAFNAAPYAEHWYTKSLA